MVLISFTQFLRYSWKKTQVGLFGGAVQVEAPGGAATPIPQLFSLTLTLLSSSSLCVLILLLIHYQQKAPFWDHPVLFKAKLLPVCQFPIEGWIRTSCQFQSGFYVYVPALPACQLSPPTLKLKLPLTQRQKNGRLLSASKGASWPLFEFSLSPLRFCPCIYCWFHPKSRNTNFVRSRPNNFFQVRSRIFWWLKLWRLFFWWGW